MTKYSNYVLAHNCRPPFRIVKERKACACQLDEIIITSSDVSACMALSSIQLTIIQAENFFSFVIHYGSFAMWGIVVKKSKKNSQV